MFPPSENQTKMVKNHHIHLQKGRKDACRLGRMNELSRLKVAGFEGRDCKLYAAVRRRTDRI